MTAARSSSIWSLRRDLKDYVRTAPEDTVVIFVNDACIYCDRATARLLAKRISQCLDATTVKALRDRERAA
jgi:hypothetical protein